MQFSKLAVVATLGAAVSAHFSNETWVTTTVTALTTVCPASTTLTFNGVTYTATASETITITNCPCTVSFKPTASPVAPIFVNSTGPAPTKVAPVTPVGTVAPTSSKPPAFTGAANKAVAGSAAGLAGLLGMAAYFL